MKVDPKQLVVYIPDTRGTTISRYGRGNLKIGLHVYTYSKLAGYDHTCPGASSECEAICYAKRIEGPARQVHEINTQAQAAVPAIPDECLLLRIHVSGDFDSVRYIERWRDNLVNRPDVHAWAYTRSWRVPELLPALERLRALPNVQLFASMDESISELPPAGWRRAWIDGDYRAGQPLLMRAHGLEVISRRNSVTFDRGRSFVCPEETKHQPDCASCRYCIDGQRNDVTFLRH